MRFTRQTILSMRQHAKREPVKYQWLLIAVCAVALTACSKNLKWTEEVQLQSGEVILVQRTAKFRGNDIAGGGGGSFNEGMTIQIYSPAKPDNPPIWDARFVPLVFDRDPKTKEWFVVATFYHCTSWEELGRPKLPYTEFRLKSGRWIQQELSSALIGRTGNMLTNLNSKKQTNQTLATKLYEMGKPGIGREYIEVSGTWKNNC